MCIACLQAEDQGEDGVLARAEDELGRAEEELVPVEEELGRVEEELGRASLCPGRNLLGSLKILEAILGGLFSPGATMKEVRWSSGSRWGHLTRVNIALPGGEKNRR